MKSIFFIIALAHSLKIQTRQQLACVACGQLLSKYGDNYESFCEYPPALGSMATCLIENFNSDQYYEDFLNACSLNTSQFYSAYQNATRFINDTNGDNSPTRVSNSEVISSWTQLYTRADQMRLGAYYGAGLIGYWGLVIILGSFFYWLNFLLPRNTHGRFYTWIRRKVILSPTFGHSHANSIMSGLVPLRFETLIISGWIILCVISVLVDTVNLSSDVWDLKSRVAVRSGLLTSFSVPLLILFAGRNNFTQWLTGWSQSRFILFHKWIARITFILLIVHASCRSHIFTYRGAYNIMLNQDYVRWGIVGVVCFGILVVHSWSIIRNMNYEIFLLIHHIFVVLFIVSAWKHTDMVECTEFYYAATVIWAVDKFFRIFRFCLFGIRKANLELIADEIIKVSVSKPSWWKSHPGSVAYIYFLQPNFFWQSHPFSIIDSAVEENKLTSLIKIKGGLTHGLYKMLQEKTRMDMGVLIEGPYAQRHSGNFYDNIVMLSTGTGVSGLYQAAMDLIKNHSSKRVRFYWIVRHEKSISWILKELMLLQNTMVEPIIWITSLKEKECFESEKRDNDSLSSIQAMLPFVEFRKGRPDMFKLIDEEVQVSQKSIAFITCGNPMFVDDARNAVIDVLKSNPDKRVELFEDFQAW